LIWWLSQFGILVFQHRRGLLYVSALVWWLGLTLWLGLSHIDLQ